MKKNNINCVLFLSLITFFIRLIVSISEDIPDHTTQDKSVFDCGSPIITPQFGFPALSPNNEHNYEPSVAPQPNSFQPYYCFDLSHGSCIFEKQCTQTFAVSAGPKFLRLYFNPTFPPSLNISNAIFTVSADQYTLLTTTESSYPKDIALHVDFFFIKEYWINVESNMLNVTFTPSGFLNSFGFVNRIEVVSIHPSLYFREEVPIPLIGHPNSEFYLDNSKALETMYRLNVGGDTIPPENDTGMFRPWSEDSDYLIVYRGTTVTLHSEVQIKSWYIAPTAVYATARTSFSDVNMTWLFPIECEFYYLIRLHFCEVLPWVTSKERFFRIFINNQTAEDQADVIRWSNRSGVPVYMDYIVKLTETSNDIVQNLCITLQRNEESLGNLYPILNGLEIFKLSDAKNSLAGSDPFRSENPPKNVNKSLDDRHKIIPIIALAFLTIVVVVLCCYVLLIHFPRISSRLNLRSWYNNIRRKNCSGQCRYFSLAEIKSATNNFSETHLIGSGGYGNVYKGCIDGKTATQVAIKRGSPTSRQGLPEFQTEIDTLSRLRHCHLVSLIGYCTDQGEMILVYELMVRGNLRDHLYNKTENSPPPLPWEQRLKICIDAARGLHFLHTGMDNAIIHRDVKTTNILLNEEFVAKVSDFGLSKLGPNVMNPSDTHVSTDVKGTFGYLDPEYYRRHKLTQKSDVYSFGVVLFEVLCARSAVIPTVEDEGMENYEQANLAQWALHCDKAGSLEQIIDPYLKDKIDPECFKTFTEIAKKCLADGRNERPAMDDVLCNLVLALDQQIGAAPIEGEEGLCTSSAPPAGAFQIASPIRSQQVLMG